jgi:hypothetical protein
MTGLEPGTELYFRAGGQIGLNDLAGQNRLTTYIKNRFCPIKTFINQKSL